RARFGPGLGGRRPLPAPVSHVSPGAGRTPAPRREGRAGVLDRQTHPAASQWPAPVVVGPTHPAPARNRRPGTGWPGQPQRGQAPPAPAPAPAGAGGARATQMTTYVPSNAPVPEGEVIIERGSTAQDVGPKLNRSAGDVVRFLLLQGEMVTATQSLSDEMIELFAAELGATIKLVDPGEEKEAALQARYFDTDGDTDESM